MCKAMLLPIDPMVCDGEVSAVCLEDYGQEAAKTAGSHSL